MQQFSGATVIRGYAVKIFGEIFNREAVGNTTHLCECDCVTGDPLSQSAYISAIVISVIRLVASLSLTYLLVIFKRRRLYLASACGTIISLAMFATIQLLSDHLADWHMPIPQTTLTYLSLVSACTLVFSVNLGVQPMPLLISSELYPPDLRSFCKVDQKCLQLHTTYSFVGNIKIFDLYTDCDISQTLSNNGRVLSLIWHLLSLLRYSVGRAASCDDHHARNKGFTHS